MFVCECCVFDCVFRLVILGFFVRNLIISCIYVWLLKMKNIILVRTLYKISKIKHIHWYVCRSQLDHVLRDGWSSYEQNPNSYVTHSA
jgi:hypothetical protein